jgi:polar amino acid transport system substrate-binding protein
MIFQAVSAEPVSPSESRSTESCRLRLKFKGPRVDKMNTMRRLISLLILTAVFASVSRANTPIVICGDEWPPYNIKPGARPGYAIEIAEAVFKPLGIPVEYRIMPWSRALEACKAGTISAVVGASKDDAEGLVVPEGAIGVAVTHFFVLKGNPWRYEGIPSLATIAVGNAQDYAITAEIDAYLAQHKADSKRVVIASGDTPLKTLMEMTKRKRIGTFLENPLVVASRTAEFGFTPDDFVSAGPSGEDTPLYIAFAPGLPESAANAAKLTEGIEKLRASGELARILAKYDLKDWR